MPWPPQLLVASTSSLLGASSTLASLYDQRQRPAQSLMGLSWALPLLFASACLLDAEAEEEHPCACVCYGLGVVAAAVSLQLGAITQEGIP